ncbi:hypothetical protein C8255_12975 [filamentous cyanobacterium CCP3]|nr:hypothetical protein C8255_12975 [filamentous cyanobacterium CCP3]
MNRIIVTDLTRFSKPEKVCIAGINIENGECIRPTPYLSSDYCKQLGILPGSILKGIFRKSLTIEKPHSEDTNYQNIVHDGICTAEEFERVLCFNLANGIEEGFNVKIASDQKYIPANSPPEHSIITIKVSPKSIFIVDDKYNPGRIRISFFDVQSNRYFNFVPITDLGFYEYGMTHFNNGSLDLLNNFIKSQERVYLRIGLSRRHEAPNERIGFWIQVNGIYTFPKYLEGIRSYKQDQPEAQQKLIF